MGKEFKDLREAICPTESDLLRFRQIVVHAVLATDIFDRDLKEHRNARWDKAFCESNDDSDPEVINRKATIVIEHLIQASDVSHTMQHWQVYRKWNERLFFEFSTAYQNGRAPNDPSTSWYEGELNFFDSYVLPLARKLKDCGVFGVSSDEYFKYAEMNRHEWQEKGKQVVADMVAERDAAESMETSNDCRLSI